MITADRLQEIPTLSYYQLNQHRYAPYVHYESSVEPNGETIAFFNGISMQANHAGNLPHALAARGYDVYTIELAEDQRSLLDRTIASYITMANAAIRSTMLPQLAPLHWVQAFSEIVQEHRPPLTATLDRYACDAAATMDGLIGKPAHIVGVSWGGALVQQLRIDHPDTVKSVIAAATLPAVPLPLLQMPNLNAVIAVMTPWRSSASVGEIFGGDFNDPKLLQEYAILMKRHIQILPHLEQQEAMSLSFMLAWRTVFSRVLRESQIPITFLYGNDDPLIPGRMVEIGARILGAEALKFESGGHGFLFSRSEESAVKIDAIISQQSVIVAA